MRCVDPARQERDSKLFIDAASPNERFNLVNPIVDVHVS